MATLPSGRVVRGESGQRILELEQQVREAGIESKDLKSDFEFYRLQSDRFEKELKAAREERKEYAAQAVDAKLQHFAGQDSEEELSAYTTAFKKACLARMVSMKRDYNKKIRSLKKSCDGEISENARDSMLFKDWVCEHLLPLCSAADIMTRMCLGITGRGESLLGPQLDVMRNALKELSDSL
jgi:hypothetical protein